MKLRLHAGSLRLRLSRSEVARLGEDGLVEDSIEFSPGSKLRYTLEAGAVSAITASLEHGNIRVIVPRSIAKQWVVSDEVGIEGIARTLKVLIEKDFQCLHRVPESDEDSFPNPLAAT